MTNQIINKVIAKTNEIAPDLLVFAGIGGLIYASVQTYKTKPKADAIFEETKNMLDLTKAAHSPSVSVSEDGQTYENVVVANSDPQYRKEVTAIYVRAGIDLTKTFALPVSVGVLSIGCILKSHNILKSRNASLAAAYSLANEGYNKYKNAVTNLIGEEAEKDLRYGVKEEEVEVVDIDDEGKEVKTKEVVRGFDVSSGISPYAKFFDESSSAWTKDPETNLTFLRMQERYANDVLRTKKRLFLNDVYAMLGLQETKDGHIVGWVYDDNNPNGDNYVDFGIYDLSSEAKRAFVNGLERSILLDFNVDGNVWQLMRN